jgi:hypothetical protein
MSKGPGTTQRAILTALADSADLGMTTTDLAAGLDPLASQH